MNNKVLDLTGKKFGRLTVLRYTDKRAGSSVIWDCICDCGNLHSVAGRVLTSGDSNSCGCYAKEMMSARNITHGLSGERRLYNIWSKMKRRCIGTDKVVSKYYHDRGISYCEEWDDFETFYDWSIENGYSKELTLDRIDNNGDYCPDNCRWVDMKVQSRNKRGNRVIVIDGVSKCITDWCEINGINVSTVNSRINRGMDEVTAITKPVMKRGVID